MRIIISAAVLLVGVGSIVGQGSLSPSGAPGPTMKTLDQLDAKLEKRTPISSTPFTITNSGSYYVTTNLNPGSDGISIQASYVTLDLSGFTLTGDNTGSGIIVSAAANNVSIRNGFIRNFGNGINGPNSSYVTVERVQVITNLFTGINVGAQSRIVDCVVEGAGFNGIWTKENAHISRCTAKFNVSSGINAGNGSVVRDSLSVSNVGSGMLLASFCQAEGCTASGNSSFGFNFLSGGLSVKNTAIHNSSGFSMGEQGMVQSCMARANTNAGFFLNNGGQILHCTSSMNGHGIQLADNCMAVGNSCFKNTGNGLLFSVGNTIENNQANENDTGLNAAGIYNVIVRNVAVGNTTTNISASAANTFGPGVFLGPALTNGNPHANYHP